MVKDVERIGLDHGKVVRNALAGISVGNLNSYCVRMEATRWAATSGRPT